MAVVRQGRSLTLIRRSLACVLAVVAVAATGCGASPDSPRNQAADTPGSASVPRSATPTPASPAASSAPAAAAGSAGHVTGTSSTSGSGGTSVKGSAAPKAASGATATGAPAGPAAGSTAPDQLPLTAEVTPACVARGGLATITVQTVEKAAVAYVAIYAGDKSGAQPPFGYGYGGNEGGTTDFRGTWTARWTVAPNAPTGPAYATLVVSARGVERTIDVPFSVGEREVGGCGT